jgi:hypothetical protein
MEASSSLLAFVSSLLSTLQSSQVIANLAQRAL